MVNLIEMRLRLVKMELNNFNKYSKSEFEKEFLELLLKEMSEKSNLIEISYNKIFELLANVATSINFDELVELQDLKLELEAWDN